MENLKDYYKILGVSRDASENDIKQAFRNLAKKYHPDFNMTGTDDETVAKRTRIQQEINEAWEVLKDAEKRKEYDRNLAAEERRQQAEEQAKQQSQEQARRTQEQERASQNAEKTQQQAHQRQQETTNQQTENRHQTRSTTTEHKGFINDIKTAWKEVKEEEKKMPFFKRHKTLNGRINRKYDKGAKTTDKVIFQLKKGVLHVSLEAIYHLEKLTHITEDTIPKYIIRNRAAFLAAIIAVCLVNGANTDDIEKPLNPNQTSSSQSTPLPTEDMNIGKDVITGEDERQEEAKINQSYTVYRTYTVSRGDTLSELAEDANCSVSDIQLENNLDSDLIKIGETLYIPYNIETGDLMYATVAAYCPEGMSLEDFAKIHSTDVASITALNEEAIENGQALTDELLIPSFATPAEIENQKAAAGQKTR